MLQIISPIFSHNVRHHITEWNVPVGVTEYGEQNNTNFTVRPYVSWYCSHWNNLRHLPIIHKTHDVELYDADKKECQLIKRSKGIYMSGKTTVEYNTQQHSKLCTIFTCNSDVMHVMITFSSARDTLVWTDCAISRVFLSWSWHVDGAWISASLLKWTSLQEEGWCRNAFQDWRFARTAISNGPLFTTQEEIWLQKCHRDLWESFT